MTKEDKELLLKDLSARLPYNPMVEYKGETYNVLGITFERLVLCKPFMSCTLNEHPLVEEVKLYLYPLSTMTEEQEYEWDNLFTNPMVERVSTRHTREDDLLLRAKSGFASTEYLDKNFFDYRGLIPMGLALDARGLNIY